MGTFASTVIKSIQRGTSVGSATIAINAVVMAKSRVTCSYSLAAGNDGAFYTPRLKLTSTTNISALPNTYAEISWECVEYY